MQQNNNKLGFDAQPKSAVEARLAALAAASAKDGALIDLQNTALLYPQGRQGPALHANSRRLLSDDDYEVDGEDKQGERRNSGGAKAASSSSQGKRSSETALINQTGSSGGKPNGGKHNSSMDLILINGTWHLIDLDICHKMMAIDPSQENGKFHNHSHLSK